MDHLGGIARTDDGCDAEFAGDDGSMAGATAFIGYNADSFSQ